jgi:hypothetical protein
MKTSFHQEMDNQNWVSSVYKNEWLSICFFFVAIYFKVVAKKFNTKNE